MPKATKEKKPASDEPLRRSQRFVKKSPKDEPPAKKTAPKTQSKPKKPKAAPAENSDAKTEQGQKAEAPADTD
ncbi:hypothetical protein GJAV_G00002610 [Gymnothorax javanicus]|nr:hypothetical protein GJAV_G00002610 [Gymnothorax javanicus]